MDSHNVSTIYHHYSSIRGGGGLSIRFFTAVVVAEERNGQHREPGAM